MDKKLISTGESPAISIGDVLGDLQVKGWEQLEVAISAESEELDLVQQGDAIQVSCRGDCFIRLPQGAAVQVENVHGDGYFKLLEGSLTIGSVYGSLVLRSVAVTQVDAVHGELSAKHIDGSLAVKVVNGHADVRDVHGACTLEKINGHLDLRDVEEDIKAVCEGNVRLRLSSLSGTKYEIQAQGNARCHIPEEPNVKLDLTSQAEVIKLRLPDDSRTVREEHLDLTLGTGEISMKVSAGGVLYLFSQEADWSESESGEGFAGLPEDFHEQIARQVESQIGAQMEAMTRQLNEQMERLSESFGNAGFSPEQTERVMEQARQASERAQEKMRRAQEKIERKLEAAQRRQEVKAQATVRRSEGRGRRSWGFEWPTPPVPPVPPVSPVPPVPPVSPVSEEERLMILRMLEQKKISLEEADNLLAALEGKEQ